MFVLAVAMCFLAADAVPVNALVPGNINASSSKIITDGINNVAEEQAEMLKGLGLFFGTDHGFDLHRKLTRAEAAVLIVRFLGEEKKALEQNSKHPFTDVPAWASPYVGWLYQNKITNGVGTKLYGSAQDVTYEHFAVMLSRISIGSDDFISSGVGTEEERRFIDRENQDPPGTDFFRADAVSMLTRFMRCTYLKDQNEPITVAQLLLKKGVFTAEQFVKAGLKVYPVTYSQGEDGSLTARLEGVPFRKSKLTGINGDTSYPARETPYFYVWKDEGDATVLYRMDCLTLEADEVTRWTRENMPKPWHIAYFATLGGKDFLGIWHGDGVSLVSSDGMKTEKLAMGKDFGIDSKQYWEPYIWSNDKLVVTVDNTVFVITDNNVVHHVLQAGVTFVGAENGLAVLYSEKNDPGEIQGVRLDDWTITDTYRVPPTEDSIYGNRPLLRQYWGQLYGRGGAGIYGEAGLFTVREGRLERVTERPVLDVGFLRIGPVGAYVVLSHEPGSPLGSMIYEYDGPLLTGKDGYAEIERLSNDPPHGIVIDSIQGADSMVFFSSRTGVGMDHYDVFTYYPVHNSEEDHMGIVVMSFAAGRPEISFAEHDQQWYVLQEQERLNALGYNP
ncbi:MAG: S-layer homology domain-containing protein [Syntrophomonadaceae bacterium]|nr:S-layer homology domain-containing protein [Syntrophomonadaceae bacterium]